MSFIFGLVAMLIVMGIVAPKVLYVMLIILAVPLILIGLSFIGYGNGGDHMIGAVFVLGGIMMMIISSGLLVLKPESKNPQKITEKDKSTP